MATGYPKTHIDTIIDHFLEQLTEALATEGRVELRDFAVLRTVTLPARLGRNPKTGEPVQIASSRHVRFRAGKHMRERLNEPQDPS
ncbi:MAG TPA: HU family DNA-binding protein [Planctomycetes bacterium]|nr:HU family DNA-binding protein [Planctomycetota bacterium]